MSSLLLLLLLLLPSWLLLEEMQKTLWRGREEVRRRYTNAGARVGRAARIMITCLSSVGCVFEAMDAEIRVYIIFCRRLMPINFQKGTILKRFQVLHSAFFPAAAC